VVIRQSLLHAVGCMPNTNGPPGIRAGGPGDKERILNSKLNLRRWATRSARRPSQALASRPSRGVCQLPPLYGKFHQTNESRARTQHPPCGGTASEHSQPPPKDSKLERPEERVFGHCSRHVGPRRDRARQSDEWGATRDASVAGGRLEAGGRRRGRSRSKRIELSAPEAAVAQQSQREYPARCAHDSSTQPSLNSVAGLTTILVRQKHSVCGIVVQ
jgi:hypothetical protein